MKYDPKNYLTRAREAAEQLKKQGINHIDFIHSFYSDETRIITSKAFDKDGKGIAKNRGDHYDDYGTSVALDTIVDTTNKRPEYGFYSYSPANHVVVEVGNIDWNNEYDGVEPEDNGGIFPAPILDENYEDIIKALTWQPDISGEVMRQYANHKNTRVRQAVASNPNTSNEILEQLAKDPEHLVQVAVAKNPALPEHLYAALTENSYSSVRIAIAENGRRPPSVLVALVAPHIESYMFGNKGTVDEVVFRAALQRDDFPINVLLEWYDIFRGQPNHIILERTLADHPQTPKTEFIVLSQHQDKDIRQAVAENSKAPLEVLFALTKDTEYFVRDRAWETLREVDLSETASMIEKIIREGASNQENNKFYEAIAFNKTVPPHVVQKLPRESVGVRYFLAGYGNTPRELLEELAKDETKSSNAMVIGEMARERLNSEEDEKQKFWENVEKDKAEGSIFWDTTARSKFATEEFLLSLLKDTPPTEDEEYSQGWTETAAIQNPNLRLETIITHHRYDIRQKVAAQARATTEQLEQLASDPAWQVRMEVARNLNTPPHVLELLAKDEHPSVKGAVRQNLAAPRHLLKRASMQEKP